MKPIEFKEHNIVFAKNQKQYLSLPAWKSEEGIVLSCWKLTFFERMKLLFTGKLWLKILTFNKPLQPQRPLVDYPFEVIKCYDCKKQLTGKEVNADYNKNYGHKLCESCMVEFCNHAITGD